MSNLSLGITGQAAKVLIVEGEPVVALVIRQILGRVGLKCEWVPDGHSALSRLEDGGFDLLITCNESPHFSGCELVESVRAMGFRGPIVVHSSPLTQKDTNRYRALGVTEFLVKPCALLDFLAMLRRLGLVSGSSEFH